MYSQLKSISFRFFILRLFIQRFSLRKVSIQSLLLLATFATAQASGDFVIKGTAEGLPDQKVELALHSWTDNKEKVSKLASANIVDGKFELKGLLKHSPSDVFLWFPNNKYLGVELVIDASDMSLSLKLGKSLKPIGIKDDDGSYKSFVNFIELKGSSICNEYTQVKNYVEESRNKLLKIYTAYPVPRDKKAETAIKQIKQEAKNHLIQLIKKHPNQFKSFFALKELHRYAISEEEVNTLLASLGETLKNSALVKQFTAMVGL